ncbi:MAG: tyrosine-type recombinase/integrase [Candidatus Bathyarchaeia archaeon]
MVGGKVGCRIKPSKTLPSGFPQPNGSQPPKQLKQASVEREVKCPECKSGKIWRDGLRYLSDGRSVQRYICRSCSFRFSESTAQSTEKLYIPKQRRLKMLKSGPDLTETSVCDPYPPLKEVFNDFTLSIGENVSTHVSSAVTTIGKNLNALRSHRCNAEYCASDELAKNSAKAGSALKEMLEQGEKRAAGATEKLSDAEVKGKIVEYLWYLKKQGYATSTVETYVRIIKILHKNGANLYDPESVKKVVALQNWSKGRKWNVVKAYSLFLKMRGLTWDKPRYKPVEKLPFIPTEREIDDLTAACSKQISTFLQLLKETGARLGEAFNLKWTDIDLISRTIRITPEKGSEPRIFCISEKLATMIGCLPKTSDRIWIYKSARNIEREFRRERKRIAHKLGNPRILQIHFHTLRHWKATIEYAKTKDILYVQKLLGHKSLKTTLRYTQLVNYPHAEEYVCKVAKTVDEAKELVEAGFEYVTDMEGVKLFKKLKTSYLGTVPSPSIGPVV